MLYGLIGVCCLGAGIFLGGRGVPAFKKRVAQATIRVAVNSIAALPDKDRRAMAKAVLAGMRSVSRSKAARKRVVRPQSAEPVAATDPATQAAA